MKTKLITPEQIEEAVDILKSGGLVAFPTETVYGLGAIANDEKAIQSVYNVKGRPSDNPLIVHVASKDITKYVESIPSYVTALIDKFWPGPLTIICKMKKDVFAPSLSKGRDTVALRMPNYPLTIELIDKVGFPIVGPSANTSGTPSPTRAAHVLDDFFGKIEGVLYGENAKIGIESTVIDVTDENGLVILRPGKITLDDLKEFPIKDFDVTVSKDDVPRAPGMKYKHYAPRQPIFLIDSQSPELWDKAVKQFKQQNKKIGIMADDNLVECYGNFVQKTYVLGSIEDVESASKFLYDALRFFDKSDVDVILSQAYEKKGLGVAFMNRLEKAANNTYFTKDL